MICVGIDVAKEKSMVCILKPYGEVLVHPYELTHTEADVQTLIEKILSFNEEVKVVMEATGAYHLPLLSSLKQHNLFVAVINPLVMKRYAACSIRKGKTDRLDSVKIANYGLDNWFNLKDYKPSDEVYEELKYLGRQYYHYSRTAVEEMLALTNLLDRTMPGIKKIVKSKQQAHPTRDKLLDFVETFWHFDVITAQSEAEFTESYNAWAEKNKYRKNSEQAAKIYAAAAAGIPTLSSSRTSTQMLTQNSVKVLKELNKTLEEILTHMQSLAGMLPEYEMVKAMPGVGEILACKLIAEIGDVRRFKNSSALVAYAGIDSPPHESGSSVDSNCKISKRGSSLLRKTGYELMICLKSVKPEYDSAVYDFLIKKEGEGKPPKVAKIAAFNKFLRIYYARAMELYAS